MGRSTAKNPRAEGEWQARWREAGAAVNWEGAHRKQMVALKTSRIWMRLSRFGTPWPPFDFGSTRELEDVWRDEAEQLGLISPDERIAPTMEKDFNDELEARASLISAPQMRWLKDSFGDQVLWKQDEQRLVWQGNLIGDLVRDIEAYGLDRPFDNTQFKGRSFNFGVATRHAENRAMVNNLDVRGDKLVMTPDTIYHMLNEHGEGREDRGDQRPLTRVDIEAIPYVWRYPDTVYRDGKGVVYEKKLMGRTQVVTGEKSDKTYLPSSVRVKID